MRPISNLTSLSSYKLDQKVQRSGFIALYEGRVGAGKNPLIDVYYALCAGALVPAMREMEVKTEILKDITLETLRDKDNSLTPKSVIKKNLAMRRLEFRTPLVRIPDGHILAKLCPAATRAAVELTNDQALIQSFRASNNLEATPVGNGRIITGEEVSRSFALSARAREVLGNCLIQLDATKIGGDVVLWATFGISLQEAEYLTNSSFAELRLSDLYPTLISWVASVFGRFSRPPKSVTKVSAIADGVRAATADRPMKPRIGLDGLVADIKGAYYFIPEVDQSAEYEQRLLDYGLRDDGSYSWDVSDPNAAPQTTFQVNTTEQPEKETKRKLPKNMPIFSDWLNDKFCYSNTVGNLAVYDLSDTVPVKEFHIASLLGSKFSWFMKEKNPVGSALIQMLTLAGQMDSSITKEGPQTNDSARDDELFQELVGVRAKTFDTANVRTKIEMAMMFHELWVARRGHNHDNVPMRSDLKLKDMCPGTNIPAFKFIGRMIERASKMLDNNIEVLYMKISVMSALQLIAYGRILTKYGSQFAAIEAADLKAREVYLNQGVDPNYEQTGAPFVKNELMFQPHQAKVDNVMRGSPDFAAYDVDAGGGKTILVMTNIFNEMQRGVCKRPIVACPPPLVAQYVEEVVFVAEGRVNVIPVTNSTLRMHGPERLKMMLDRAPINTIVVTDFDFVKGRGRQVSYGNKSVNVFVNAEWLRQFEFDLIAVDESHKLANVNSSRREGMARLMQDIPKKRLASGTFVNNTITDLVSQVALFDPTIFGSREKFHEDYAANTSGDKVLSWKPGAEKAIRDKISEHVVFATARRKEWAALLPPSHENFHASELTVNQRMLYESILKETTDLIEEAMAKDPELSEAMNSEDESVAEDLESMLRPYLVRLERFLSAPAEDELADMFLKEPEDRVSPKVNKIYELCRQHKAGITDHNEDGTPVLHPSGGSIPGKVLIFTNYLASAEAVFEHAPPDLKPHILHYTADKKVEARAQFARNKNLWIMVGASSSMDTGLNFQHVSRLIRMETVWTPGLVEQGNSRINRPQLKKAELRDAVYFDWLMVNRTIDVTKIARLTAKMVSKAKFDEADTPSYQALDSLPVISMSIPNIAEMNDFEEELLPYLEVYGKYKQAEEAEYKRYREENAGRLDPVPVKTKPALKGSGFMSRVPYVQGMTIYGTDQLGLVRYDEFVHQDLSDMETEDTEVESGDTPDVESQGNDPAAIHERAMRAKWAAELQLANNMPVHTEFGDGVIYGARKKVWVLLNNGERMRIPKLQVFVITRTTTNMKDVRLELQKAAGELPLDAPIEVPVEQGTQTIKRRKKEEEVVPTKVKSDQLSGSFNFSVINDILAIVVDGQDNQKLANAVQNFGFKMSPEYWFTKIRGPVVLLKLFKTLDAKKFKINPKCSGELKIIYDEMRSKGRERMSMPGFATDTQIRDFTREQIKPTSDPFEIKAYPRVEDGQLYLMMPKKGQPATARAIKVPSELIKWVEGGGESEYIRYCKNKAEAQAVMQQIKASGIIIENEKDLAAQWKAIKMGK
jgi:hypothetical protein